MASAAALGSIPRAAAGPSAMTKIVCYCYTNKLPLKIHLEISADETLNGLIEKVRAAIKTRYPVTIRWDGRDGPSDGVERAIALSHSGGQYLIQWENHKPSGPEIRLSYFAPERIQKLTGVKEAGKSVKVSREVFDKLKVSQACDIQYYTTFDVIVLKAYGRLPRSAASAPSAHSALSSARTETKEAKA